MYNLEYLINWLVFLRTPIKFIDSLEYLYIQLFYGSITSTKAKVRNKFAQSGVSNQPRSSVTLGLKDDS